MPSNQWLNLVIMGKTQGKRSQLCDGVASNDVSTLYVLLYSPMVSDLELPGPVSQEASVDPFWDFPSDVGADGLGGLLH